MQLHCFGTAGYHPSEDRHTSSYYLPEDGIALDAGSGFFRVAQKLQSDSIDILISHAHLDHVQGLTFLLDTDFHKKLSEVRIWGEAEKLEAIREHLFHHMLFPAPLNAQWRTVSSGDHWQIGDVAVTCRDQEHPGGSLAYRLDWPDGRRLVYATDTTGDTSETHANWSRKADLLIHECYFTDAEAEWAKKTGHSWVSRVAQVAEKSNPKKLLLTHLNPIGPGLPQEDILNLQEQLESDVIVAADHQCIEF